MSRFRLPAIRLFTLAGVPVQVHGSLVALLMAAVLGAGLLAGWREALRQGLWWLLLFGAVLLHELGHLAAARLLRVPVTAVVLWPMGGFTAVRLSPGRFRAELGIALAGPSVNLLLALLIAGLGGWEGPGARWRPEVVFGWLNLLLGLFNLLPVFPMDGGRILRSALAMALGEGWGTWLALRVGQAGALGIGGLAIWQFRHQDAGGLVTMLIAMWLLGQTLQETQQLRRRERLQQIPLVPHLQPLPLAVNDRIPEPAARRLLQHSGQADNRSCRWRRPGGGREAWSAWGTACGAWISPAWMRRLPWAPHGYAWPRAKAPGSWSCGLAGRPAGSPGSGWKPWRGSFPPGGRERMERSGKGAGTGRRDVRRNSVGLARKSRQAVAGGRLFRLSKGRRISPCSAPALL